MADRFTVEVAFKATRERDGQVTAGVVATEGDVSYEDTLAAEKALVGIMVGRLDATIQKNS